MLTGAVRRPWPAGARTAAAFSECPPSVLPGSKRPPRAGAAARDRLRRRAGPPPGPASSPKKHLGPGTRIGFITPNPARKSGAGTAHPQEQRAVGWVGGWERLAAARVISQPIRGQGPRCGESKVRRPAARPGVTRTVRPPSGRTARAGATARARPRRIRNLPNSTDRARRTAPGDRHGNDPLGYEAAVTADGAMCSGASPWHRDCAPRLNPSHCCEGSGGVRPGDPSPSVPFHCSPGGRDRSAAVHAVLLRGRPAGPQYPAATARTTDESRSWAGPGAAADARAGSFRCLDSDRGPI